MYSLNQATQVCFQKAWNSKKQKKLRLYSKIQFNQSNDFLETTAYPSFHTFERNETTYQKKCT